MSDLSKQSDGEIWQALADTAEAMSNLGKYQKYLAIGEVLPKDHASRVELVISNIREASVLRHIMADDTKHFKSADDAVAILKAVYARDGADAAVQAAQQMIDAAAAFIAHQHGPDEARRILQTTSLAQGRPTT
jgi:hypothetical protein